MVAWSHSWGCSRHLPPSPQALGSTKMFYAPRKWDCAQAFSVVYGHDYRQPMAIAQVLPALVGKSYLEAASLKCTASTRMSPRLRPSLPAMPSTLEVHKCMAAPTPRHPPRPRGEDAPALCPVAWRRAPTLPLSPPNSSHPGALLHHQQAAGKALQRHHLGAGPGRLHAAEGAAGSRGGETQHLLVRTRGRNYGAGGIPRPILKPTRLPGSFQTEQTSWGPMVVSIHGLAGNTDDRTYWQFFSGTDALQEGGQPGVGGAGGSGAPASHPSLCRRGRHLQAAGRGAHPGHLQHLLKALRDARPHRAHHEGNKKPFAAQPSVCVCVCL